MAEPTFETELDELFDASPRFVDEPAFVDAVQQRLRRQWMARSVAVASGFMAACIVGLFGAPALAERTVALLQFAEEQSRLLPIGLPAVAVWTGVGTLVLTGAAFVVNRSLPT